MEHQAALLLGRLGLHKPHVGPGHRFTDGLGVSGIVLLSLDVRPHIGRRHQAHAMPKRREFARPMMRRGAGLDTNEARGKLLKERQDVAALQLTADEHVAFRVDAVHLKYRLRYVETDGCDRLHDWLLRIVGALTAPHSHGTDVPVDGAVHSITSGPSWLVSPQGTERQVWRRCQTGVTYLVARLF